jgi:hypothetical protein
MRICGGRLARSAGVLLSLALVPQSPSAAPRLAAALGPEVAIGEPSGGYVGRLTVMPEHGPAGASLTVTAEGLPAGEEFQLVWRTVDGAWKVTDTEYHGREYRAVAYEIAKAKTDQAGHLSARFVVPEDFGFMHDIVLQQSGRLFTQTGFSIDMAVEISPASGPVGTPITVEVRGIGWRSLVNSWDLLYDNNFTGWISSVTTHGSARFTIPATGAPGTHILEVLHGELTFPYRIMQQSPEPDRPRWAIPFTVTAGPPVLPPPPGQQTPQNPPVQPPQGELVAMPQSSGVGEPVLVQGDGLTPGQIYQLNWTRVVGNRMTGAGWQELSTVVAENKADGAGRSEFRFTVPDDLGGGHGLWIDAGSAKKTGTFWITPRALPLDVSRGPVGTAFTVHLKGVGWTETANIYHLVYDNSYIGYACAFNSQGDVEIPITATGMPGWHFIDLYPGIYRGAETRPNNFRIPQLTYAQDHPGEDLPAFHFAFEVTPSEARAALSE